MYDARLLLDDSGVPSVRQNAPIESSGRYSPTGWSNLPSDAEDTFFFSTEETEDYRREKRRRLIEKSREDRLKAMRAERKEEEAQNEEEQWGGSDEEPDDTQRELMRRTASHLSSSPNPAQLEMRILANHGADRRFAFLKGRWSRAWKATKARIRLENEKAKEAEEKKANATSGVLGGLTGYGDSDEDSDAKSEDESTPAGSAEPSSSVPSSNITSVADDESLKAARRARAKEWMERRRAEKAEGS
ncbi:hypothetical protein K474DRAFT_1661064 [Panus rudis PR-1116 ss-1]|nr:hypothetical protein K474DRAFT_1661064 [Panus rudis PR-1116 ss-1]